MNSGWVLCFGLLSNSMSGSIFHEDLQLANPFSSVPDLLRRLGIDPAEVFAAAGLNVTAMDNPQGTIPYAALGTLFDVAAHKTGCAHFGLEVGKYMRTQSLGLIGQLMRNAATVGVALQDFTTNQHRNSHGSVAYLLADHQHVFWGYAVYHSNIRGYPLICDCIAMGGFNVICELIGAEYKNVEVLLSRSEPQDLAPYHRAFAVKLRFNAEQTALLLPRAVLDYPVAGADAGLRTDLEKRVAALWHAGELDTVTQLRRILRVALLGGQVSVDEISARMGMSRRTLHRRLEADGLRFQTVLDETRCEFARQLLACTRLSISDIANIVGYADPSIFTRKFTRWTGLPPSKWRLNAATVPLSEV
jgi:AraC-like DNA-binding protein